ncbi:hypothetical protein D3C73_1252940 [compost metagenome]
MMPMSPPSAGTSATSPIFWPFTIKRAAPGTSTTLMRSEPSSLATLGIEPKSRRFWPSRQKSCVFLSAEISSRHRLLRGRLFRTTPMEALGFCELTTTLTSVMRPASGAGPTFTYSVCSLPGVPLFCKENQPSCTPAVHPCNNCCLTVPARGPSCCSNSACAGAHTAPRTKSRAAPRKCIRISHVIRFR